MLATAVPASAHASAETARTPRGGTQAQQLTEAGTETVRKEDEWGLEDQQIAVRDLAAQPAVANDRECARVVPEHLHRPQRQERDHGRTEGHRDEEAEVRERLCIRCVRYPRSRCSLFSIRAHANRRKCRDHRLRFSAHMSARSLRVGIGSFSAPGSPSASGRSSRGNHITLPYRGPRSSVRIGTHRCGTASRSEIMGLSPTFGRPGRAPPLLGIAQQGRSDRSLGRTAMHAPA